MITRLSAEREQEIRLTALPYEGMLHDLLAEIDALRADLHVLEKELHTFRAEFRNIRAERDALQAENEKMKSILEGILDDKYACTQSFKHIDATVGGYICEIMGWDWNEVSFLRRKKR